MTDTQFHHSILLQADIPGLQKFISGKVREVFDLGDKLLIVATDRLSAFDVVLPTGIPGKGWVLTQISAYWFDRTRTIVDNHMIGVDIQGIVQAVESAGGRIDAALAKSLDGRSMLVQKAAPLPVECVVRGYICGSLWKDYSRAAATGSDVVSAQGVLLQPGLVESEMLEKPIFTPTTKATTGHDTNLSWPETVELVGEATAQKLRDLSIAVYKHAAGLARQRGIIIADTKFEFGAYDNNIILIDEALTPDSSRFWPADAFAPGRSQASFDKQIARDYLEGLDWDKTYPGPDLPSHIVERLSQRYLELYRRITGGPS